MIPYLKHFFLFVFIIILFGIYNELTLNYFMKPSTETVAWLKIPYLLVNVILLARGAVYGVMFIEETSETESWLMKYAKRWIHE